MAAVITTGVEPESGPNVSHDGLPLSDAVHCSVPEPVLDTAMLAGRGLPPPSTTVNVSADGNTDSCAGAVGANPLSKNVATLLIPLTLAKIMMEPPPVGVAVICAVPLKPVVTFVELSVAEPENTLNETTTPLTGLPNGSLTTATKGAASALPGAPDCPLPLTTVIVAGCGGGGGGAVTVKVPLTKVNV